MSTPPEGSHLAVRPDKMCQPVGDTARSVGLCCPLRQQVSKLRVCIRNHCAGFPAALEIRENPANKFPFFGSGKTQRMWRTTKNQGKFRKFDIVPEGKVFARLAYMCVLCHCVSYVHLSCTFCVHSVSFYLFCVY